MIVEFTKSFLDTGLVVPPGKQREEFCDTVQRGLVIQIAAMFKSDPWYLWRYKAIDTNKTAYRRIAPIREITITQARKQVAQWKAERSIAASQVVPEQKPVQGEMTLDSFWNEFYLPSAKLHKRSWQRDEQLYRLWLKQRFGACKLVDLSRTSFLQYQAELAATHLSPASQDHVFKLARRLAGYATELELLERNPLKGIKLRLVPNELHDVATDEQLQKLVGVLQTDANRPVCNILLFLLSTGARVSEALKAKWSEVDLDKGVWYIPAENAKSKRGRTVPLNQSALCAIEEAGKRERFEVIFANPETGKAYTRITRTFYRLRKAAGITKMRIHSCRHQYADRVLAAGGSLYSVQMLLGHADPRVSQRYAKLSMKALHDAANMAALSIPNPTPPAAPEGQEAVAEASPTAEILPFPKAA